MRYTSYSLKKMSLFPAGSYPVNNRRSKHEFVPLYIYILALQHTINKIVMIQIHACVTIHLNRRHFALSF